MKSFAAGRATAIAAAAFFAAWPLVIAPAHSQGYESDDGQYYDSRDYDRDGGQNYDREGDGRYEQSGYDGEDAPDVSFFYSELEGEGRWISHRDYGYVWSPNGVDDDWRPYSRGYWANTDEYGWYWVSEETFGWATYHYGRWAFDDRYGWVWVPGTTWGPAWVAWRSSDEHIGWAPLPPEAAWDSHAGLRYDVTLYESPRFAFYWSFIEPRYISTPSVYRYCAPRHRARTIIYSTRPQTNYTYLNARIVNRGISVSLVERHLRAPLPRVRVYATDSRRARGFDRRAGDTVRIWRPDFKRRDHGAGRNVAIKPAPRGLWRNVDRPNVTPAALPGRTGRDTRPIVNPSDWNKNQPRHRIEAAPAPEARPVAPARKPTWFSTDRNRDGIRDGTHSGRTTPYTGKGWASKQPVEPRAIEPRVIEPRSIVPRVAPRVDPRSFELPTDVRRARERPVPRQALPRESAQPNFDAKQRPVRVPLQQPGIRDNERRQPLPQVSAQPSPDAAAARAAKAKRPPPVETAAPPDAAPSASARQGRPGGYPVDDKNVR